MRKKFSFVLLTIPIILSFFSCSNSEEKPYAVESIRVRIQEEPDRLHPILSKTGISQHIESRIFLPLMAPDPKSFDLEPILLQSPPRITKKDSGGLRIDFTLRNDLRWPDRSAITTKDVEFTLKSIFAPGMGESNLRAYFDMVDSISTAPHDSLSFAFHLSQSYILALPATSGLSILPAYHYDPKDILQDYSLLDLRAMDSSTIELTQWVEQMKAPEQSRTNIRGSGPYAIESWETGRYIHLKKKEAWWGQSHSSDNPLLIAKPENIFYQVIPDESTAIQLLKSGRVDIVSDLNPLQVKEFVQNETLKEDFNVHFSNVLNQYVVLLNTEDAILKDVAVRRALAHLIDVDQFIEEVLMGYGSPARSPIHPSKPFFDSSILATNYSPQKAEEILEENGWLDLEESGVREKRTVEGDLQKLEIELLITGSSLSQSIALKLREKAAEVGINIEITTLSFRNILQRMRSGDYQMTPLSIRSSPFPYDPYQTWHTNNIGGGGGNYTRFGSDSSDAVIDRIRNQSIADSARSDYEAFQRLVNESQPVLYLAAPLQPLITPKNIKLPLTAMKPGYFENAVEIRTDDNLPASY
jgi:peptide/nickel transport system substrate-binding protein